MLTYKGYTGYVEYDDRAKIFAGEVIDTNDVITFQGRTPEEIEQAFRDSIDDYLEFCEELGRAPEKPYSGKLSLRLNPATHRHVAIAARKTGQSINEYIEKMLEENTKELLCS